ncbi:MAG: hypothetical protein M0R17_02905 [Candidatus Omnitrophica bacterium]|jgi:hypothetical protein|nr:hypothetical protein [Candidatus Omnitrophota bacterium]
MKTRIGFVSNSSSSSFIIGRSNITNSQIIKIQNHIEIDKQAGYKCGCYDDDLNFQWDITVTDDFVEGYVFMDNFDMYKYLSLIGIDQDKVEWR